LEEENTVMMYIFVVLGYFVIRRKVQDIRIVTFFLNIFFVLLIPMAVLLGKPNAAVALGELAFVFYFILLAEVFVNIYKNRQLLK